MQVVTNTGCIVLGNIAKIDNALLGEVYTPI